MKRSVQAALMWLLVSPFVFGEILATSSLDNTQLIVFQGAVAIAALITFTPWLTKRFKVLGALRAVMWPFDLVTTAGRERLSRKISIAEAGMVLRDVGFGSARLMFPYTLRLGLTALTLMTISELFPEPIFGIWLSAVLMFSALPLLAAMLALLFAVLLARSVRSK